MSFAIGTIFFNFSKALCDKTTVISQSLFQHQCSYLLFIFQIQLVSNHFLSSTSYFDVIIYHLE